MDECIRKCDSKIRHLFIKYPEDNSLPIDVFYDTLRQYNLKDALTSIAEVSKKIYNDNGKFHHWRPFVLSNQNGEMLTTMSMLADLTFHFINSNSNDRNNSRISDKKMKNVVALSKLCFSKLNYQKYSQEAFNPYNALIMLHKEQGDIQMPITTALARNYLMFQKIINDDNFNKKRPSVPKVISEIFQKEIDASIHDYFFITFILFVYVYYGNKISFKIKDLQNLEVEKDIITPGKINTVIKYLSCTYKQFIEKSKNNKFINPLLISPIIEFDDARFDNYIIPNLSLFFEKCWNGIFHDIESLYQKDCGKSCRGYFGYVFEEYVGLLLSHKFPNNKIWDEISYNKSGSPVNFFDWVLELEKNKSKEYYLIEVKSKEVPLEYIYEKSLDKYFKDRVINELRQIPKKILDIEAEQKLKFIKGQNYYPIVVFKNIPFINSSVIIESLLSTLNPDEELYKLIKEQKIFIFNIDDFENFVEILDNDKFDIIDLFKKQRENQGLNLSKIMQNIHGDTLLRNSLLDKTRNEIFAIIKAPEEIQQ